MVEKNHDSAMVFFVKSEEEKYQDFSMDCFVKLWELLRVKIC